MLGRIIFFLATSAAILAVLILALFSPIPQNRAHNKNSSGPWLLCFHPLHPQYPHKRTFAGQDENGALTFSYKLTQGPKNTSRAIGEARGFFVPSEHAGFASFCTVYLTFNTPAGSLCLVAKPPEHGRRGREELAVVGGTGAFTFARGGAVVTQSRCVLSDADAAFCMEIKMMFHGDLF